MKRVLSIGLSVAAMFTATMSHADFTFYSTKADSCETISGTWSGSGKGSNWLLGECAYHGEGIISTLDETGQFTLNISVDKDSGSFICPKHEEQSLKGTCVNGVVTLLTDYGNLTGDFSDNAGSASGSLSAMGMSVEVSAQFHRSNEPNYH